MKTLITFAVITAIIALYAVVLRPWLRTKQWAEGWFRLVDPVERVLYRKSESLLWNRWLGFLGILPPTLQAVGAFDITPFLPLLPPEYAKYAPALTLVLTLIGGIGERLRRDTTKPLEIVALPEDKPLVVEQAVKKAEAVTKAAVEVAKEQGAG